MKKMVKGRRSLDLLLVMVFPFLVELLFLCQRGWTLNLNADAPTLYSGPTGSYFGFALDFFQDSKGSMNVVVGAPRANTSQPDVIEAGAVYLCPWEPNGSNCIPIDFDTKGDQVAKLGIITVKTFKSKQWFGASVNTWKQSIMACAPLLHWNAMEKKEEATKTPVGSCFLATGDRQKFSEYSPCRNIEMHSVYNSSLGGKDKRYCEIGFSFTISQSGRVMLGAPGGYYFTGLFYSVALSEVEARYPRSSSALLWSVSSELVTEDYKIKKYNDGYQGYSVAMGEFNENSTSQEYVVGIPNMSLTQGRVEILTMTDKFRILWTISSEQVASYFGHTVTVADVNGDGKDDILVGAPLFMVRRSDGKLYEVGRVYLYLQQKSRRPYRTPWQKLTGTDIYGRFGMAIAPLGDIDQDGYIDIAIGAPFAGQDGGGQVYIYRGQKEGLSTSPSQILKNPFSESAGFGFAIRGASDIDDNGYPDVLVGAFRTGKVAVYRTQPMVILKAHLSIPDVLDSEMKTCPGAQASCFNIQMCVGMSGRNIPSEIELNAELQLDHMKQKFGRRVLLQQTSQPSDFFQLKLSQKIPQTCKNITAYLRDQADFKDKLSAIVVSLNFSLASFSRAGTLQPILSGQLMVQEQTRIILDCGEDNICIPDLKISAHTNEAFLLIGTENVVLIHITATNAGEGAYETELVVELPFGAYFQRANSSAQKLICNFRKENETQLVSCEVGNPMKSHTEIKLDLELSVSQLEDANSSIVFVLQLKSKNSLNPNSNLERLKVPLKVDAQVELFGISIPAALVVPWTPEDFKNKSNEVDGYGPNIEHIYRLQNAGPSTISGADLFVHFPSRFWKGCLLYITKVTTEGSINCLSTNETNPLKLKVQEPTNSPSNLTIPSQHWRERRDVSFSTFNEPSEVNCSSQLCAVIHCQVGILERGHGAMVTIHSVLWLPSFQEFPEQLLIQSQAQFTATGMPYSIRPEVLPSGAALAKTLVEWVDPDAERDIPIWWILTAVLVGLFLLAVSSIVLWKTGFFKRNRPPTEEEEELTHDPGVQAAGDGQ
ncbi:integrin alpha-IIb isoform X2 [Erythrolamprus reginae]|uniref:integrin alpha-IIb isoform X2 n=1 Tax=Erythrolamprus reginae TaxID=121349 RepID=UPI00396C6EC2